MATGTNRLRGHVEALATVLVVLGALNWGLVGFGGLLNHHGNVIEVGFAGLALVGAPSGVLEPLVYLSIGIAGLYVGVQITMARWWP